MSCHAAFKLRWEENLNEINFERNSISNPESESIIANVIVAKIIELLYNDKPKISIYIRRYLFISGDFGSSESVTICLVVRPSGLPGGG